MVRGLIFGLIWGVIFMGIVLGVTSLLMPLPEKGAMVPSVVEEVAVEPVAEPVVAPVEEPQMEGSEAVETVPAMNAPSVDPAPALEETTAAIMPDAGTAESSLDNVVTLVENTPEVSVGDAPSASEQPAEPLTAPLSENDLAISTEPAQPVLPAAVEEVFEETLVTQPEMEAAVEEDSAPVMADEVVVEPEMDEEATEDEAEVVINRLPTVSQTGAVREDGPLALNSVMFDNPDSRPTMSIILIDTGEFNIGPEALAAFPYPLTFAIDPLREDALDKAEAYRSSGFELVALAELPVNGVPELADLALVPTLDSIPGLIGALEGLESGVQGNMGLAEAVLEAISGAGYGLILRPKGMNAAQQMADGRDLPVATIFRDFDDKGQDAAVIRRFLDQAAFKARQEGEIIMVGRLRPATISALLLWGLQDRASSVALAPVSAILQN